MSIVDKKYTAIAMPDGRVMHLFGAWQGRPDWPHLVGAVRQKDTAHMRWHPLRQEWVTYASARQKRTYKPAANACPLCPNVADGELPFDEFTIAVFENRFPSFQLGNLHAPEIAGLATRPAKGMCEVVVYCSKHEGNLATIPQHNRETLLSVWGQRRTELFKHDAIRYVMPFENRGEDAGVTLHHPHGQIYAFEDLPPIVSEMAAACRSGFSMSDLVKNNVSQHVMATDQAVAFVPPFARYPYEMWVAPRKFHASADSLNGDETQAIADLLRRTVLTYDGFFGRTCPYLMLVYMAPKGYKDCFPFHIQFYPLLRTKDRMKYLAGCEQGAGMFLGDVLPEVAAEELRVAAKEIP